MTPPSASEAVSTLEALLHRWARTWATAPLRDVLARTVNADAAERSVSAHLFAERAAIAEWLRARGTGGGTFLSDPVTFLTQTTRRWLQQKNQFLELGDETTAALRGVFTEACDEVEEGLRHAKSESDVSQALSSAVLAVHDGVAQLVAAQGYVMAPADPAAGAVICAEYSPELQLEVLGIEPTSLMEPILDLGCGRGARLVHHLRQLGMDAVGVDYMAEPAEGVWAADWFAFPLAPQAYGTVISNLGFTHHFQHHHLRGGDAPRRYAERYMTILRSLRVGGAFVYAPGLPFLEPLLPGDAYSVTRSPIPGAGDIGMYAARVTRTSAG